MNQLRLYRALFSKALLKCIKILPDEILDRICGQSVKETGDCSQQLQQLIFELLLLKLNCKWTLYVVSAHLKTKPIHTSKPMCRTKKGPGSRWPYCLFIYLFGVLRRFQHCTGHITTGSWKGRGNQYIEFVRVLYCKLPTNGKQLPAFPLEAVTGIEPQPQRWEARVLLLCHHDDHIVSLSDPHMTHIQSQYWSHDQTICKNHLGPMFKLQVGPMWDPFTFYNSGPIWVPHMNHIDKPYWSHQKTVCKNWLGPT